jgi:hypothetical protein
MRVQEIFEILANMGLVRSQMEFSRIWLGKSPRYYSSLLARQQQPSVGTLTGLLFRLRNIMAHTNEGEARSAIFTLIQRLERYVAVRSITSSTPRSVRQGRSDAIIA